MGGTRLEQSVDSSGKTDNPPKSAAQSGAFSTSFGATGGVQGNAADDAANRPSDASADSDLGLLIECWPTLPAEVRKQIVELLQPPPRAEQ